MLIFGRHMNFSSLLTRSFVGHWPDSEGSGRIQPCRTEDAAILVEHNMQSHPTVLL
jgi:hypothetical protein